MCSYCQAIVKKDLSVREHTARIADTERTGCQHSEEHALPCIIHPTTRSTGRTGHPFRHLDRKNGRARTHPLTGTCTRDDIGFADGWFKHHPSVKSRFENTDIVQDFWPWRIPQYTGNPGSDNIGTSLYRESCPPYLWRRNAHCILTRYPSSHPTMLRPYSWKYLISEWCGMEIQLSTCMI